ncbi:Acyltransferase family [Phytophthora cinnamomi]|uniref:Acyltransferase family n=1 Tax=Phytophthora cinnamomi TaxID=4785 RepID=UPI003559465F|nr:Acyltransferase family [Phytophthora cinnamomi]
MLRSHGPDAAPNSNGTTTNTPTEDVAVHVQSAPEDQPLLTDEQDKDKDKKPVKAKKAAVAAAPPTKVLFLDGVRGLAAMLVVTQHSHEYMQDLNLGAVAVDSFFVLSSFLLTWLFTKKSIRMVNQDAGVRKWFFALCDYFSKRFCRVYPLFAVTCVALWAMSDEAKKQYFLIKQPEHFDLYKTLTFEFEYRYFVFWTLPLEISYYFFIPVFVAGTLMLRKFWWVPFIPAYYWVVNEGWNDYRTSHSLLRPHIPTFLAGSMAAVIFVKLDTWIKASGFQFRLLPKLLLRTIEFSALAVFLSIAFRGLFFIWVHKNTAPKTPGFPFVSVSLTTVFVCEMLLPSALSSIFEWSFLRYWGKISFSVYLLHSFVLYNKTVNSQPNYYCRMFSRFGLLCALATASYHLVEYPSQLLAQRITKALTEQETKGSGGLTVFWGEWANPSKMLAQRLAWAQEAKASGKWMEMLGLTGISKPAKAQPHDSAA